MWYNLYTERTKGGTILKKIVNGLIAVTILAGVGIFGLKDIVIQKVLEKELTNSLESKVRIYGVDYYIFKERLELKGIGVESKEDDSLDAIYVGKVTTNIKFKEIFNKKIALQNLEIKDIELNKKTKRENKNTPMPASGVELANKKIDNKELEKKMATAFQDVVTKLQNESIKRNSTTKSVVLGAIAPVLDEYVDYSLSKIATKYMEDIIEKYNSMRINFKERENNLEEDSWVVEISDLSVKTKLLGRDFVGIVNGITTDKTKMNKDIPFSLKASSGNEVSSIDGSINIVAFKGEIDSKFENIDINNFLEQKELVNGTADLVQKIILDNEKISITGRLNIDELVLFKEKISKEFLGDENSLKAIVGDTQDKINDLKVEYNYNPRFNRVFVNSNIADKIIVYLGGDTGQFDKLKQDFNDKYGEKIEKTKEELKYKLEEFINVFNKN